MRFNEGQNATPHVQYSRAHGAMMPPGAQCADNCAASSGPLASLATLAPALPPAGHEIGLAQSGVAALRRGADEACLGLLTGRPKSDAMARAQQCRRQAGTRPCLARIPRTGPAVTHGGGRLHYRHIWPGPALHGLAACGIVRG
jgi:hypothetical protein